MKFPVFLCCDGESVIASGCGSDRRGTCFQQRNRGSLELRVGFGSHSEERLTGSIFRLSFVYAAILPNQVQTN